MNFSTDILNRGGYTIKFYSDTGSNKAHLIVNWKKDTTNFEWADETFKCPEFDFELKCPIYIAPLIANSMLIQICEHHKFPMDYVQYFRDNKQVPEFDMAMDFTEDDAVKFDLMNDIYINMLVSGVTPDMIETVRTYGLQDAFKILFKLFFEADINF